MVSVNSGALLDQGQNGYIVGPEETILVTGANGFVGSKVVEILLEYGFKKLRCLIRSSKNIEKLQEISDNSNAEVELFKGNLLSRDDCLHAANGVSLVYHLAAGVEKSFPGCFLNSVVSTRNLLDALIQEQTLKRFVNTSSIAVYSNEKIPRGGLMDESCEVDTRFVERWEAYTYGKAKQDEIVMEYAKKHNFPYVIVRPSVVFGPGKPKITDRIGTDTFGIFLHLGLNNTIPLTYLDNCAEGIVLAGLKKGIEGQVFNIFDDDLPRSSEFLKAYKRNVRSFLSVPVPYRVWLLFCTMWEKYSKWSEGQLPPAFNSRKCSIYWKGNRYSNKKAKELLGWQPRVPMKEALQRFFSYMRDQEGHKP
jgi:nucleoside-diphosphate-sugar epimerase